MEPNTQALAREIEKGLDLSEMVLKTMTVIKKHSRIEKDGKEMIKIVKCKVANYVKDDKPLRISMENLGTATTKKIAMESLWDSIKSIFAKIIEAISNFFKSIFGSSASAGAKQKSLQNEVKAMEDKYTIRSKLLKEGVEVKHTNLTGKLFTGIGSGKEYLAALYMTAILEHYSIFTEGFAKTGEYLLKATMDHLTNNPPSEVDKIESEIKGLLSNYFKDLESFTIFKGTLINALKADKVENVDVYNLGGDVLLEDSTYLAFFSTDGDNGKPTVSIGNGFSNNDVPSDSTIIVNKSHDFKKLNEKLSKIGDEKYGVAGTEAVKALKALNISSAKHFASGLKVLKTLSPEEQPRLKPYIETLQYITHCIKSYGIYSVEINKAKIGLLEFTKNSMQAVIDANGKDEKKNKDSK